MTRVATEGIMYNMIPKTPMFILLKDIVLCRPANQPSLNFVWWANQPLRVPVMHLWSPRCQPLLYQHQILYVAPIQWMYFRYEFDTVFVIFIVVTVMLSPFTRFSCPRIETSKRDCYVNFATCMKLHTYGENI